MNRQPMHSRSATGRAVLFGLGCLIAVFAPGDVRAEPPIKSPQDAYCRAEAKARVFTMPDPQNVGLHAIGRQLYAECMRRISGPKRAHRRKHRRHRR